MKNSLDVTWISTITITLRKWRQFFELSARQRRLGLASKATGSWCLSFTDIMRNRILYIFCKYIEFQTPHSLRSSHFNGNKSEYARSIGVVYNITINTVTLWLCPTCSENTVLKVHMFLCSFTEAYMWQNSGNSNTTNLMINPIRWWGEQDRNFLLCVTYI